jgi:hypothetical protein
MSARAAATIAVTAITGRTIIGRIIGRTIVLTTATGLTIIGLMDMATVHIIGLRIIGRMVIHTDMDPVSESASDRALVSASAGKTHSKRSTKKQALERAPVFVSVQSD